MVTDNYYDNPDQQVLEIFEAPPRKRKRRVPDKKHLLEHKLHEVIMGVRPVLKVYSAALKTDLWFVNEGLIDPAEQNFPGKVITMAMLVEMMSDDNIRQLAVSSWQ